MDFSFRSVLRTISVSLAPEQVLIRGASGGRDAPPQALLPSQVSPIPAEYAAPLWERIAWSLPGLLAFAATVIYSFPLSKQIGSTWLMVLLALAAVIMFGGLLYAVKGKARYTIFSTDKKPLFSFRTSKANLAEIARFREALAPLQKPQSASPTCTPVEEGLGLLEMPSETSRSETLRYPYFVTSDSRRAFEAMMDIYNGKVIFLHTINRYLVCIVLLSALVILGSHLIGKPLHLLSLVVGILTLFSAEGLQMYISSKQATKKPSLEDQPHPVEIILDPEHFTIRNTNTIECMRWSAMKHLLIAHAGAVLLSDSRAYYIPHALLSNNLMREQFFARVQTSAPHIFPPQYLDVGTAYPDEWKPL